VILTSGASGAIDICITALANPGQNVLVPRPGFALYETQCASKGIKVQFYDLQPDFEWEIDLVQFEALINDKTAAVVINNPSNPCGSVFSPRHLRNVMDICERRRIPIIADEIYSDLVFEEGVFTPMAHLSNRVPILAVGGLAKKWLVPGWRLGWILIYDPIGAFSEVREGIISLTQLILGPNTLIQYALPRILNETPAKFYENTINVLKHNAHICCEELSKVSGLDVVRPRGSMYMMVGIQLDKMDIHDDMEFTEKLFEEESVMCLPGQCFRYPGFFRIVYTAPDEKLKEACARISAFMKRHLR